MGKHDYGVNQLKNWRDEGWTFRIKKSKKKDYITRRKGGVERSLGPFNRDLWKKISEIQKDEGKKIEETSTANEVRKWVLDVININRAGIMSTNCRNKDEEGYCTGWQWPKEAGFLPYAQNLSGLYLKLIRDGNNNEMYVFFATGLYCTGCTKYQPVDI